MNSSKVSIMVLESISNTLLTARKGPKLFVLGFVYATAALFLANWIFEEYVSLVMVFLAVMASLPLFYKTIIEEEAKDLTILKERTLLKEHSKAIKFFLILFIGLSVAFAFWYVALPADMSNSVFKVQTQTIANLNQHVTGSIAQVSLMNKIFLNNVKVMIFCILFSFIYGSGAIFILAWNASVIGAAGGNFIKTHIAQYAGAAGLGKVAAYMYASSLSILRYSIHGVPEIAAYVVAGLAGGILSVAIIKGDYKTKSFERILLDVSDLIIIALFILFTAAILEVFVTPLFF